MPNIFDISIPQQVNDILPLEKRTNENKSFIKGLMSGFKYMWDLFLAYKRGSDIHLGLVTWVAGTYTLGEQLIYDPTGEVYEVIVASTSTEPSTSPDWKKVQKSFIGVDESQHFNGSYISLTYALNRQYQTLFVQDPDVGTSEIYLEIQGVQKAVFRFGLTDEKSSAIGFTTSRNFIMNDYNITTLPAFIIKVPGFRFPTFGPSDEKLIRAFVDQYLTFGVSYTIEDY